MTGNTVFKALLLIARPAAGKSEIIDYLKNLSSEERARQFHIGNFSVIDDFPMLWAWFEEDDILTKLGHPRMHTLDDGSFIDNYLWDVLIQRIDLEYFKLSRDTSSLGHDHTAIIEFSRGCEHGGYARAFAHLSDEVLQDLAILYVDVSWEESLRKNRKRYNPDKPDSILEHGLSDDKLEILYKTIDWEDLTKMDPNYIEIKGFRIPYVVFKNDDDVTTGRGEALAKRLKSCLDELWGRYD